MSKISLEFDTETKKLVVSVNGEVLSGVESCYIYKKCHDCYCGPCGEDEEEEEEHYIEIGTKEDVGDETMSVYKRICAAEKNISIASNKDKLLKAIAKKVRPGYKG